MGQPHFAGVAVGSDYLTKLTTVTTKDDEEAVTFTAAELLGGLILRDPNGDDRADLVPTAAQIIAALDTPVVGTSFEFTIRNTSNAGSGETITLTPDTGATVTISGTATIVRLQTKRFKAVVTSGTAVTIYSLGTLVY